MKTIVDPWIYWKIYSIEPMTEQEAKLYQIGKGYVPAGYGFESFKCVKEFDRFKITWQCYASCD